MERIRGRKLQRIRKREFAKQPLCVLCLAKDPPVYRFWTQSDHKDALARGGKEELANRQGLCDECHKDKTAEEFGLKRHKKPRIGPDGFPEDE